MITARFASRNLDAELMTLFLAVVTRRLMNIIGSAKLVSLISFSYSNGQLL